jgi:hypothetical protein
MIKTIAAIAFVYLVAVAGWITLGNTISYRTDHQDTELIHQGKVERGVRPEILTFVVLRPSPNRLAPKDRMSIFHACPLPMSTLSDNNYTANFTAIDTPAFAHKPTR